MPTYRVTDPNTGKTVKLTGDAPPTEQELEDVFKSLGPVDVAAPADPATPAAAGPSLLDTAIDVGKGAVKGAVGSVWNTAKAIADVSNTMAVKSFGKTAVIPTGPSIAEARAARASSGASPLSAAIAEPVQQIMEDPNRLAATNRAQLAGKGLELGAELVAGTPALRRLAGRLVPGKAAEAALPALAKTTATAATPLEAVGAGKLSAAATGTGGWSIRVRPGSGVAGAADEMVKQVDNVLTAGHAEPAAVAEAVEQQVPQTVREMVSDLRRMHGSDKAGKMIYGDSMKAGEARGAIERLAPGPSRHPLEAEVAALDRSFYDKIADPRGAVNPVLAQQLGGATAGAAIGATQGEDTQDRVVNGLLGAGIGATAVPLIARLATGNLTRTAGSITPKEVQDTLYSSILSSPTSVAKAYLGALGGTVAAATEKVAMGDAASGARILRTLMSPQSVSTFVRELQNPTVQSGIASNATGVVGRVFGAGDAVARRAMAAGGIGADEAARFTLSGAPTTPVAQDMLKTLNKYFELRLFTTLFPRVGMQIAERGIERSPLGLLPLSGINEGASQGLKLARAGMGTAAGIAGYAYSDQVPDWAKPYVAAASGVYALPLGVGMAAGMAADKGKGIEAQAKAGVKAFANNLPFPQYGPTESIMQFASGSSLIPAYARDVAVARDPFERDTSGSMFDRGKAKLPGLREQLPVKGRRVNIAGEPITDRSTPLKRVFNPAPTEGAPFAGIPESVKAEIQRLGVKIDAPSYKEKETIGKTDVEIPPAARERLQRERREYVVPAIEKLLATPSYQAASDAVKKRRLDAIIQQAEERGNAKARATIAQVLRGSRGK